ncbi:MAG: hypothetical protein ABEK75_12775 [Salinibacter sp.]
MSDDVFGSASDGSVSGEQDASNLQESVSEEEMTQLNVEIPRSLHRRLKVHSVQTGKDMKEVVRDVLDRNLGA